jgi:hypothetical protein
LEHILFGFWSLIGFGFGQKIWKGGVLERILSAVFDEIILR